MQFNDSDIDCHQNDILGTDYSSVVDCDAWESGETHKVDFRVKEYGSYAIFVDNLLAFNDLRYHNRLNDYSPSDPVQDAFCGQNTTPGGTRLLDWVQNQEKLTLESDSEFCNAHFSFNMKDPTVNEPNELESSTIIPQASQAVISDDFQRDQWGNVLQYSQLYFLNETDLTTSTYNIKVHFGVKPTNTSDTESTFTDNAGNTASTGLNTRWLLLLLLVLLGVGCASRYILFNVRVRTANASD